MTEELEDYILSHIDNEPAELASLDRETHLYHLRPRMCSGHLQGMILKMFVRMIRPKNVLELGTFTGYSAIALASGLEKGGQLHTVEIDDELEDFIRSHIETSPYAERITLHIGDALEIVPKLGMTFDLAFVDANKRHYKQYYEMLMNGCLNQGGFIIADNTLWDGKVAEPNIKTDAQTKGILEFNDFVAADRRAEKVILPVRDGLTIIHKIG